MEVCTSFSPENIYTEIEQRELRRDNVIIFGLPEKCNYSLDERKANDHQEVCALFDEIDIEKGDITDIHRIGRLLAGRSRPLKVRLTKLEIFRKSKLLRGTTRFSRVFISSDKTKLQQEEWSNLRKQLRARQEAGENVVIYKGEVRSKESLNKNFRL